jgi:hypothetical protein
MDPIEVTNVERDLLLTHHLTHLPDQSTKFATSLVTPHRVATIGLIIPIKKISHQPCRLILQPLNLAMTSIGTPTQGLPIMLPWILVSSIFRLRNTMAWINSV